MPPTVADTEAKALQLSVDERVHVIGPLLASLPAGADVDTAWATESRRRLEELASGTVADIPVDDSIARASCASTIMTGLKGWSPVRSAQLRPVPCAATRHGHRRG